MDIEISNGGVICKENFTHAHAEQRAEQVEQTRRTFDQLLWAALASRCFVLPCVAACPGTGRLAAQTRLQRVAQHQRQQIYEYTRISDKIDK